MQFYNRETEITQLQRMEKASHTSSKMTVMVGRRRIGKTKLIQHAFPNKLYFFVSKKSEPLLCHELITLIEVHLKHKVLGQFTSFPLLFEYLIQYSITTPLTLVIDEFQEFLQINASIYSDLQRIWDQYKDHSKLNLVLSGSIYSLMKRIFEDRKEPLFGRADTKIHLKPFTIDTLKVILQKEAGDYEPDDLLSLYMFTGGVAKYVELFIDAKAFTRHEQINLIFDEFSPFIDEGKNLLIEEFGREYTVYFSILSLITSSKTSRPEMESILGKPIGGYLDRLENEYMLIKKIRPIFSKPSGRTVKYAIADNFFHFWFRFIYSYKSAIEIENYAYVKQIVERDYAVYSGLFLEKYFFEKLKLSRLYSQIGTYWERGNQNEIDLVAVNDLERKIVFIEVKRQKKRINLKKLEEKAQKLVLKYTQYEVQYQGLSLEDL